MPVGAEGQTGLARLELYDNGALVSRADTGGQTRFKGTFAWQAGPGQHTLVAVARDAFGRQASAQATVTTVAVGEHVQNGGFEAGFGPDGTATGWARFDNGGRASYRFEPETWPAAIYEG